VHGHVVDFISLHWEGYYFPAFNIADTAITLGTLALLVDMLFSRNDTTVEEQK
jgi:signal peptidase II